MASAVAAHPCPHCGVLIYLEADWPARLRLAPSDFVSAYCPDCGRPWQCRADDLARPLPEKVAGYRPHGSGA